MFPNSFKEIEELQRGGFYIYDDGKLEWLPLQIHNVCSLSIDCSHKTPSLVNQELRNEIINKEFNDTIVTIRLFGTLASGKPSEINFNEIVDTLHKKSAFFVMKNTASLVSKDFEEIKIQASSIEDIEERVVREHLSQSSIKLSEKDDESFVIELMNSLNLEKAEDERQFDFERKLKENVSKLLKQ